MLLKNINHKGRFLFTPMQNSRLIWPINECFEVKREDLNPGQTTPNAYNHCLSAYFTALTCSSFDEAMGDFNEKIILVSHRTFRTALNFEVTTTLS